MRKRADESGPAGGQLRVHPGQQEGGEGEPPLPPPRDMGELKQPPGRGRGSGSSDQCACPHAVYLCAGLVSRMQSGRGHSVVRGLALISSGLEDRHPGLRAMDGVPKSTPSAGAASYLAHGRWQAPKTPEDQSQISPSRVASNTGGPVLDSSPPRTPLGPSVNPGCNPARPALTP